MSKNPINDGGAAFPCNRTVGPTNGTVEDFRAYGTGDEGMSLRDYFAAKADPREVWGEEGLPTWLAETLTGRAQPSWKDSPTECAAWWAEALAKWKLMAAAQMIAARKEPAK